MRNHISKQIDRLSAHFDHKAVESNWRKIWEETGLYQPDIKRSKNSFYNLMMFPYPSALGLHVGNIYAFVGSDIYGRLKRMQGFDVFEPIGLDGFGIHSENFALKVGKHPMDLSKKTESNIYAQLHATGNGFAWSHKLETYISDYYKWTQWIFIQLFKQGLAYRSKASVNWCSSCLTVLADEQVVNKSQVTSHKSQVQTFVCERCGTEVEKRELEQWFFKITNYAQRLLSGLEKINWSEKVKVAQRNWLGKSEGLLLKFSSDIESNSQVEVFTTRPDTLYGVTFMVLAPEHPQVIKILDKSKGLLKQQIQKYVADSIKKPEAERIGLAEKENQNGAELVKTGIKTSFHCTNPASGKRVPIFIADYVVMSYGTGAVMGVPAHDQRDYLFAKKYQIDIVEVISGGGISQKAFTESGTLVNSEQFNGLNSEQAIASMGDYAVKKGFGQKKVLWHLRDWIISRQRYWGAPIPMIYCKSCEKAGKSWFTTEEAKQNPKPQIPNPKIGNWNLEIGNASDKMAGWYPVPEKDLPVELPYIKNFKPTGTGVSPLATDPNFVKVKCPYCGSEARRETDVSDTFLDSAWYFLRYPSQSHKSQVISHKLPWDPEVTRRWLPVDMYIGGAEHSVLHLLYSRFLTMAFYDMNLVDFEEPFSKFRAHGLLIKEGAKMSKSRGNVVLPDPYIEKFGADTLRTYLMFCGRFDQGGDFRDTGIEGMSKFLKRVWKLVTGAGPVTTFPPASARSNQKSKVDQKDQVELRAVRNPSSRATRISQEALYLMHKTIKKVSEDIENLRYNTAISAIMEWVNFLEEKVVGSNEWVAGSRSKKKLPTTNYELITKQELENLLLLLAPFAPYMAEELWSRLQTKGQSTANSLRSTAVVSSQNAIDQLSDSRQWAESIHIHPWPKYDEKAATSSKIELVVQVNGKVRDKMVVDRGIGKEDIQRLVLDLKNTQKYLSGKKPTKIIFVKDRLINIVV